MKLMTSIVSMILLLLLFWAARSTKACPNLRVGRGRGVSSRFVYRSHIIRNIGPPLSVALATGNILIMSSQ
jgi:hypothetical protein